MFNIFSREIILFARKIITVYIVSSLNEDVETKSLFVLFLLIIAMGVNYKNKPFYTKKLNNLEMNECFTIFFIIICMEISTKMANETVAVFGILIVVAMNTQFLFFAIKDILIFELAKFLSKGQKNKKYGITNIIPKNLVAYCSKCF